ncbi:MAG: high-affinity branched-chain amino acid ABC transporter permease LivM [Beijerinckiaceae bacterium]
MGEATKGRAPSEVIEALKSAGLSALIMLGLSFPIIAFRAEPDFSNQLYLVGRWPLVLALCSTAFVLRFSFSLTFDARAARRAVALDRRTSSQHGRMVGAPSGAASIFSESGLGLLGIAVLLAFPLAILSLFGPAGALKWIDNYGIQILIYVMLGWGLNIVVGLAGLLDLGYIAFYAVGAYTCALLATTQGWSFWLCLPIAGALAALWGIILGFPVLRLRGDYLAIVTLAFGEIIRLVLLNWSDVTNGDAGIGSIPKITFFGLPFTAGKNGFAGFFGLPFSPIHRTIFLFYVILTLALVTNLVALRLRRLPIGRAWEALREDEIACRALGINTVVTKLSAFALGAAFGGLAGAFFTVRQGFVSPSSFTFIESATILAIVVLGGRGSQIGVAAAAIVMIGGSELLRELDVLKAVFGAEFDPTQYRMLIVGFAMVVMMNFKPEGLVAIRRPSIFLHSRKPLSAGRLKEGEV